jgi:hypothetical protein
MKAFRCKGCGRLEHALSAGECATPAACSVCCAGVTFDTKGNRTLNPDNWEVLADASHDRLAELGLSDGEVERHVPPVSSARGQPQNLERSSTENVGAKDKA